MTSAPAPRRKTFRLSPGKRVLFLTKDPNLIARQLLGELDLRMEELQVADLLDDINTDVMTPAWVCFDYRPEVIARNAYAGLVVNGSRLFEEGALADGGFEVIVSGFRKGTGSSRETAVQAEKFSGIKLAVAASFAPIHARNNIHQGVLMAGHEVLSRLQRGEELSIEEFTRELDPVSAKIVEYGGLFPFANALAAGAIDLPTPTTGPRPMTMVEKIARSHALGKKLPAVAPGDTILVRVDGGYSHEFTTAQVHHFLRTEFGENYQLPQPATFAVFEDHLIYADGVPRMAPFSEKIETLRQMQREFQKHTGVLDFSARDGVSPGICHQVARETFVRPGQIIQATDSHTCMGGASNALAFGVGATEYANLVHSGFTFLRVPESIRFELHGTLTEDCTAKDVMLHILLHHAKPQQTLNRVMEFGGPGLTTLSMDERATLANMATECSAFTGLVEADEQTVRWIAEHQENTTVDDLRAAIVHPDPGAEYHGGVHRLDLSTIRPMVAHPGDPDHGIPSDPTNGRVIADLGVVPIDIAYGGSCTAGKDDDLEFYARVMQEAHAAGLGVAPHCQFFLQFGSLAVRDRARAKGWVELFEKTGVQIIDPGCGACIGCGPGVSESEGQVTVSAINRNFKGRSGPGKLYLASPLTVAASAVRGVLCAYHPGMFLRGP